MGDRRVRVRSGEQIWALGAEVAGRVEALDSRDIDYFARWDADRQAGQSWARERSEYLPEEVAVYGPELEEHGAWYYEVEVGHVWRPYVSGSWQPYSNGRWVWTSYGWTWVPDESWGWAVSHYGRWGWSMRLGWYWIPSVGWGAAWVSWATSDDYVGWSPLGHRDRRQLEPGGRLVGLPRLDPRRRQDGEDQGQRQAGRRFEYRSVYFFVILLVLAVVAFSLVRRFAASG